MPSGAETGLLLRRLLLPRLLLPVLAHPRFDQLALALLQRVYLPASRLWAAARQGDATPLPQPRRTARLMAALQAVQAADAHLQASTTAWEDAFFGASLPDATTRIAAETARLAAAHALNMTRLPLLRAAGRHGPRIRWAATSPAEVQAAYGTTRQALWDSMAAAAAPPVTLSHPLPRAHGTDHWLRFPAPHAALGDTVTARIYAPAAADPPTIIFGHGVCVDFDHWQGLLQETEALLARGFRVIRPEAPWHGRRSPSGHYSGEYGLARFPLGMLHGFAGAVQEWAVLARWARATSRGPLVFGGSSLGAMTAQLVAEAARDWPAALRPDALLLITHTGDLAATMLRGALSRLWRGQLDLPALGWDDATLAAVLSRLNPQGPPAVPPARIVSILGQRDQVLPYASGRALVAQWGVPAANLFDWDCGHFSVPTRLLQNPAPLDRLAALMV